MLHQSEALGLGRTRHSWVTPDLRVTVPACGQWRVDPAEYLGELQSSGDDVHIRLAVLGSIGVTSKILLVKAASFMPKQLRWGTAPRQAAAATGDLYPRRKTPTSGLPP